jgi:non-heme chloroperoxidase
LDFQLKKGITGMPTITAKDGVEIFYKDWGSGQPIVFSHGWPLSADDWDAQMLFFLKHGYRVIAHDRRGHGRSTQVSNGHDMDHYADDLAALTAHLDLKMAIPPAAARWRTIWDGMARVGWRRRP